MTSSSFKHDSFTPPTTPAEKGTDRFTIPSRNTVPSFQSYEAMKASSPLKNGSLVPSDHHPLSPPTTDPRQQQRQPFVFKHTDSMQHNNHAQQQDLGAFGSLRSVRFSLPTSSPTFSAISDVEGYSPHSPVPSYQRDQIGNNDGFMKASDMLLNNSMDSSMNDSSYSPTSFSFSPALKPQADDSSLHSISKLDLNDYSKPSKQGENHFTAYAGGKEQVSFSKETVSSFIDDQATRYLFVSNLPKEEMDLNEMAAALKKFGELRGIYARDLYTHGVVILSFYDTRAATKAKHAIFSDSDKNPAFSYRQLHPSFITRDAFIQIANNVFNSKVLSIGEGRLVIKASPFLKVEALESYVRSFGDVQSFRPDPLEKDMYLIDYFDDRCASKAFLEITEQQVEGLQVGWDDMETLNLHFDEDVKLLPAKEESKTYSPVPRPFPSHASSNYQPPESNNNNNKNRYIPPYLRQENSYASTLKSPPLHSPKASSPLSFPEGFTSATIAPPNVQLPPFPAMGNVVPNDVRRGGNATHYGLIRDDPIPDNNLIQFDRIYAGLEKRTSCIIRNLPNKMTQLELMENLDEIVPKEYDFIYLRFDFQSGSNCGFGFVNFISLEALIKFWSARLGTMWDKENSRKLVMGGFANIQGKKALMERFRNSSVMDQAEEYQPKIFHSSGPYKGLPEAFPPSNNAQRKAKSAYATGMFGLYGNKPKGGFRSVSMQ